MCIRFNTTRASILFSANECSGAATPYSIVWEAEATNQYALKEHGVQPD